MTYAVATSKALRLRREAARKARAALAVALVAAGLVLPASAAGLVAPGGLGEDSIANRYGGTYSSVELLPTP